MMVTFWVEGIHDQENSQIDKCLHKDDSDYMYFLLYYDCIQSGSFLKEIKHSVSYMQAADM